ncbi:hypothetical protein EMCRGX_G013153 [Ephydatia muelleri]
MLGEMWQNLSELHSSPTRAQLKSFRRSVADMKSFHVIEVELCVKTLNVGAKDQCGTIGVWFFFCTDLYLSIHAVACEKPRMQTHGSTIIRAPRSSDVNYVPYVKAERGKETMALNNYDELQSLVLEVLGQAVGALSLIGETTESPEDT